jgi:hypothetical protein
MRLQVSEILTLDGVMEASLSRRGPGPAPTGEY